MAHKAVLAFGFALFVLLGSLAVPAAIDASDGERTETETITEGDNTVLGPDLEVTVDETGDTSATVTVVNNQDSEAITETINESETETFAFETGDVNITAVETTSNDATLSVEYPSTFGYGDSAIVIKDNLPIILVTMLFIGVMGLFGGMMRS